MVTDFLEMLMKAAKEKAGQRFMGQSELEQLINAMSEGDPRARKIVENLIVHFAKRGVVGEPMVALLAGLHSIGFRGRALIEAFEVDYSFDQTYLRGTFALIRSQFPFIKDPFATPEAEAE